MFHSSRRLPDVQTFVFALDAPHSHVFEGQGYDDV